MNPLTPIALVKLWSERPFMVVGTILLCLGSLLRYQLHAWQIEAEEEVKNTNTPPEVLTRRLRFYKNAANFMFVIGLLAVGYGVAQFFQ